MKKYILFILPLLLSLLVCNNAEAKEKKYRNGDYYEGEWEKGKPHGLGVMVYANGDVYDGEWLKGKRHGKGQMSFSSGEICKGDWKNDQLYSGFTTKTALLGKCELYYQNGKLIDINGMNLGRIDLANQCMYVGTLSNDLPSGEGYLMIPSACDLYGTWKEGKLVSKKDTILRTDAPIYPVHLRNDSLSILVDYPDKTVEEFKCDNSIQELCALNKKIILKQKEFNRRQEALKREELKRQEALKREEEKKQKEHEQYLKEKEEYARKEKEDSIHKELAKSPKTYRNENIKWHNDGFIYDYEIGDVEYQYYVKDGVEFKHGNFRCWNIEYVDNIFSIKGFYKYGKKSGTWIFEEKKPEYKKVPTGRYDYNWNGDLYEIHKSVKTGRYTITRLTINYVNDKINGLCTKEAFYPNGTLELKIEAYYKNDFWDCWH